MIIKQVTVGEIIQTNAYFYIDEQTKHGFLIDAAAQADKLLEIIKENSWVIEKILLTHGHFDHIGAVDVISKELNIPYYIHKNGQQYLTDGEFNLSPMFGEDIKLYDANYLKDGDIITLEANPNVKLEVFHTPGHTLDSVVYWDRKNNIAFVGDTIFKDSIGRTDLPGGNMDELRKSIQKLFLSFDHNAILYSGHTEPTTLADESKWHF